MKKAVSFILSAVCLAAVLSGCASDSGDLLTKDARFPNFRKRIWRASP